MKVEQYQCNICLSRLQTRLNGDVHAMTLAPMGGWNERKYSMLSEVPAADGNVHLCHDCVEGLRVFFKNYQEKERPT